MTDDRYNPSPAALPLSSFKRPTPAMGIAGGRAIEQRRTDDKRASGRHDKKTKDKQQQQRVGQLDEKNLKRAANR